MSDTETLETEGQAEGTATATTQTAPEGDRGQSVTEGQTTGSGTEPEATDTFFDPTNLTDELKPAYKEMQAAFTKKMQSLSSQRQKIALVEEFEKNPQAMIQKLAQQYGVNLSGQSQKIDQEEFQPNDWNDVLTKAEERAEQRLMQKLKPLFDQVQQTNRSAVEQKLDTLDSGWRTYEDEMLANLQQFPGLVNDPAKLYRMSVPTERLESLATQRALKKLEGKKDSAKLSGGGTTSRKPSSSTKRPEGVDAFDWAVTQAKEQLNSQGLARS